MGLGYTLWVLSLKHMKERLRRLWHTVFEMLLSVLTFALLIILMHNFHVLTKSSKIHLDAGDESEIFHVLFSPHNNITKSIMRRVGRHFYMKRFSNESDIDISIKHIWGFANENQIENYLHDMDPDSFLVVNFKNLVQYPRNFNYSLGFTEGIELEKRGIATASKVTALSNLQWALDKAYMEELSGEQISHTVRLQGVMDKSRQTNVVYAFLIVCSVLAPLPFFLNNVSRFVIERNTGLKELMKMVGVSYNVLRLSHLIDTGILGIIYATLITTMMKITSQPILPHSNPGVIGFTLILHYLNITSMAFIASSLSQDYQHVGSLAILIYMMTFLLDTMWYSNYLQEISVISWLMALFLPHAPMYVFWKEVMHKEKRDKGIDFGSLFSASRPYYLPVIVVWFFFLIQLLVILTLAWYVDLVRPGKYGVAAKWNFLCKKQFWSKRKKKVNFHMTAEKSQGNLRDDRHFEKRIKKTQVAIKVASVTKVFSSHRNRSRVALRNVTMDVCRGEITVLLGPTGAGKTTLLSVVTGMYSVTSGSVYINGLDNSARLRETREALGYCPQHNVTFDYLTVKENIKFFQSLKQGHKISSGCTTAEVLMTILKLDHKADFFNHQLSDNSKRCLQVACALATDADLLVLDEPTSGMNSKSRHQLWELLLVLRGAKTILMSTTLMEEADALADRIAVLHRGHLKCYGSPTFLKQAIGTDFKLAIHIKRGHSMDKLREAIESMIPASVSMTTRGFSRNRATFGLPAETREHFPKLFDMLEENRTELGIVSMGVGMCWEQVLLSFIEDEELDVRVVDDEFLNSFEDLRYKGWRLWKQQVWALIIRNFSFLWTSKYQFLTLQVIVPLLGLTIATITSNKSFGYGRMGYSVAKKVASTTLLHNPGPFRADVLGPIRQQYPDIEITPSLDIFKDMSSILSLSEDTPPHRHVFGMRMGDLDTEIFYPLAEYGVVSEAINMFSNMFITVNMPYAKNNSIRTSYDVLSDNNTYPLHTEPKSIILCIGWSAWVSFLVTVLLAPAILRVIKEHDNGVRFSHVLAGCSPTIIWLSKLLAHLCVYFLIMPPALLLIAYFLDFDNTFNRSDFLIALAIILVEFGPAFLVHLYVLSYFLGAQHAIGQIFMMTMCFALVTPLFLIFIGELHGVVSFWIALPFWIIAIVSYISPASTFSFALSRLTLTARSNAYCRLNKHLCPDKLRNDPLVLRTTCCESTSDVVRQYYSDYQSGRIELIAFILQFIAYWIVLMLLSDRVIHNWFSKLIRLRYKNMPGPVSENEYVKQEKDYVKSLTEKIKGKKHEEREQLLEGHVVIVDDVSHIYQWRKKSMKVYGVSFAIKKGECLGILGVGGSGKSTLVEMVSGFTAMTNGNACVAGYFIRDNRREYLRNIACTRATGGLDDFLSGFDNLTLLAELYGRPRRLAEKLAMHYLQFMGLQSFAHEVVEKYSAGCSRLLAMCGALLAEPHAALFDRTATGVDLHTQPLVTRAIRRMLDAGVACLITEESINWRQIEMICNRIAIMCQGEIVAIGPAHKIRKTYASGHTVVFKLKISSFKVKTKRNQAATLSKIKLMSISRSQVTGFSAAMHVDRVGELKLAFTDMFKDSLLTEDHLTMLYFHIKNVKNLRYSEIFTNLENLKSEYNDVVEDYLLSETSIAEVFNAMEKTRIQEIKELEQKKSSELTRAKKNKRQEHHDMNQNKTTENDDMDQNRTDENKDMAQTESDQNKEMEQNTTTDNKEVEQNTTTDNKEVEQNEPKESNEMEHNRTHENNGIEQSRTNENNDIAQNRSEQNNDMEQNTSSDNNEMEQNRNDENNENRTQGQNKKEHHRSDDSK